MDPSLVAEVKESEAQEMLTTICTPRWGVHAYICLFYMLHIFSSVCCLSLVSFGYQNSYFFILSFMISNFVFFEEALFPPMLDRDVFHFLF